MKGRCIAGIFSFEKFALDRVRQRRRARHARHHKLAGGARLCPSADPGQLGGASLPGPAPPAAHSETIYAWGTAVR